MRPRWAYIFEGSRLGFSKNTGGSNVEVPVFGSINQGDFDVWDSCQNFLGDSKTAVRTPNYNNIWFGGHGRDNRFLFGVRSSALEIEFGKFHKIWRRL